jgi:hypothetical protein
MEFSTGRLAGITLIERRPDFLIDNGFSRFAV